MSYCQGRNSAKVNYIKENGTQQTFSTQNAFLDVSISQEIVLVNCWRFYGIGDDRLSYQLFASGINPGFILNSGFNSHGYVPSMNGVKLMSDHYYYVSGYGFEKITNSSAVSPAPEIRTDGSCTAQTTQRCKITITEASGYKFNDYIQCPDGKYQVVCGDDCPPGYCKIDCPHYPGYCCISCAEIDSLLLKLK